MDMLGFKAEVILIFSLVISLFLNGLLGYWLYTDIDPDDHHYHRPGF